MAADAVNIADQKSPCNGTMDSNALGVGAKAYDAETTLTTALETIKVRRFPTRSANAPVKGADNAEP